MNKKNPATSTAGFFYSANNVPHRGTRSVEKIIEVAPARRRCARSANVLPYVVMDEISNIVLSTLCPYWANTVTY